MEWLKVIRSNKHMTQMEVALSSNITQPAYCDIECGKKTPKPATAKKIAAALGFDWQRFYEDES